MTTDPDLCSDLESERNEEAFDRFVRDHPDLAEDWQRWMVHCDDGRFAPSHTAPRPLSGAVLSTRRSEIAVRSHTVGHAFGLGNGRRRPMPPLYGTSALNLLALPSLPATHTTADHPCSPSLGTSELAPLTISDTDENRLKVSLQSSASYHRC